MNANHIIIGMANTKIHLFEAETGSFIRTFSGHELGVWALYLVSSGPPPNDGINSDEVEMDGENNFNMGSYRSDLDSTGRGKARKRSRADTRRASLGESSYRGAQSSHHRNGSTSQSSRHGHRAQPGSYDPNGPFGPRYPGVESCGKRWQTSDIANAAYGWGQKQQFVISGGCDRDVKVWDLDTG
jgi:F-box and WD-40 domain protein CDC4